MTRGQACTRVLCVLGSRVGNHRTGPRPRQACPLRLPCDSLLLPDPASGGAGGMLSRTQSLGQLGPCGESCPQVCSCTMLPTTSATSSPDRPQALSHLCGLFPVLGSASLSLLCARSCASVHVCPCAPTQTELWEAWDHPRDHVPPAPGLGSHRPGGAQGTPPPRQVQSPGDLLTYTQGAGRGRQETQRAT